MVHSASHFPALLRGGSSATFHLPQRIFSAFSGSPVYMDCFEAFRRGSPWGTQAGGAREKREARVGMHSSSFLLYGSVGSTASLNQSHGSARARQSPPHGLSSQVLVTTPFLFWSGYQPLSDQTEVALHYPLRCLHLCEEFHY